MHDAHNALRGPKTPPPGVRPGSLAEPGLQRSDRSLRRSSGQTPLLGVPSLADVPAEAIDGRTLRFLLLKTLERKRKEEEEEQSKKVAAKQQEEKHEAKMKLLNDKVSPRHAAAWRQWMGIVPSSSSSAGKRGKRKKKRKKRLPKSSSSRSARTWYSGHSSSRPLPSTVHARCLRALWIPAHTSVMEAFWKISSVFGVPGSTGNAISWEVASRTRF